MEYIGLAPEVSKRGFQKSLPDLLIPWSISPAGPGAPKPGTISFTTINGHEAAYFPRCYEVCFLEYYIVNDKEVYVFAYICGTGLDCGYPDQIKKTKYYPDFMSFIQSVKFK